MNKKTILVWADSPLVCTGYGQVCKYLLKALHNTDHWDIDVLAINHDGNFYDQEKYPYQLIPAKFLDPNDVYGCKMFLRAIRQKTYDAILIINDTFVVHPVAEPLQQYLKEKNLKTKVYFYFPVDCQLRPDFAGMVKVAHYPVTMTNWAKDKTVKELPELGDRLSVIYHGTDTSLYGKTRPDIRAAYRKQLCGIEDNNTFLIINVARNNPRKDLPKTILAFSEFRKLVPNSKLYLHTAVVDKGGGYPIDLRPVISQLGLNLSKDVIVPLNYSPGKGFPDDVLNNIFNMGDCFLSTSLGEGWNLALSQSLAVGLPTIAGENSSSMEILGDGRGIMYPCKERVFIDNCYDPETEVLTINGWKYFKEVTHKDKICTLNKDTYNIEYQEPVDIISGEYNGRMYSLKAPSSAIDLLVTENHNIFVEKKKRGYKAALIRPQVFYDNKRDYRLKKDGLWEGKEEEYYSFGTKKIPMDLWVEFLGYFISEGSTTECNEGHYVTQLRQLPGKTLDRMEELTRAMGYNPSVNRKVPNSRLIIYNKELFEHLVPLGKCDKKYIPRQILSLSKRQLCILFESMMTGDGHNIYYRDFTERKTVSTKGGSSYATSSVQLRDDFQELLLKIGFSGTIRLQTPKGSAWAIEGRSGVSRYDLWTIGIRYTNNSPHKHFSYRRNPTGGWIKCYTWKEEWIDYSGPVYCVTVPNHIIYVRRNGCPVWSGNSGIRKLGRLEDILAALMHVYKMSEAEKKIMAKRGWEFTKLYSWDNVSKAFVQLIESGLLKDNIQENRQSSLAGEVV